MLVLKAGSSRRTNRQVCKLVPRTFQAAASRKKTVNGRLSLVAVTPLVSLSIATIQSVLPQVRSLDPKTKAWLQSSLDKTFGYPGIVRFSWATVKIILEKDAHAVEW